MKSRVLGPFVAVAGVALVYIFSCLGLLGLAIYVCYHFISKFW